MTATATALTRTDADVAAVARASRSARHARFWLGFAAVMVAAIGLVMITAGVLTGQPGLTVVASATLAAGGASLASAYSVARKSLR